MFDTTREYKFKIPSPNGIVEALVKFPTDEQWLEYHRSRRVIEKSLGRNQSEVTIVGGEQAAARLFSAVANGSAGKLDSNQVEMVIDRMASVKVDGVEDEGGSYRVALRFFFSSATHVLKMPTAKQMKEAEAATRVIGGKFGATEIRVNLETFAALYGEMATSSDGYSGPVPILHKHAAVQAVLSELRDALEGDGESFFS